MAMRLLVAILFITGAYAGPPRNLTMIGLRPSFMDPKDMGDKDWADAAGDLFFYIGDQVANKVYCMQHPTAMLCSCEVTCDDNVYGQVKLELTLGDASLNTVVSSNPSTNGYARCNPKGDKSSYKYHCNAGDKIRVGQAEVATRYSKPSCSEDYCEWKYNASKLVKGIWWSVPEKGNCDAPGADPTSCTWRHVETLKVVNASCANGRVAEVIKARAGKACFDACPAGEDAKALQCFNDCFFGAVFGTDGKPGMTREELVAPFMKAFDSDDPQDGGCPPRHLARDTARSAVVV